jgi:hypothetical protein
LLGALLGVSVPALALAQTAPGVGVVTTLNGRATVVRTALPEPLPLKFRDDVFMRDRISTAEKSLVRVLLGGKALVTVRELSTLTITEQAGRATVELDAGKIALGVLRSRMVPGDVVEIRTPAAITAVRGTVLAVEANPDIVTVARGLVGVRPAGTPLGAPEVPVRAGQSYNASTGQLVDLTPEELARKFADLRPNPQFARAPDQFMDEVENRESQRAVFVARALLSGGGGGGGGDGGNGGNGGGPWGTGEAPLTPPVPSGEAGGGASAAAAKSGTAVTTYSGQTVTLPGDFYALGGSSRVTLGQPLLETTASTLSVGQSLVDIGGNALLTAADALHPFIFLDPTTTTAATRIRLSGNGGFTAATSAVKDLAGSLTLTGDAVRMTGNSWFSLTGHAAALVLDGTGASVGGDVLDMSGNAAATLTGGLAEGVAGATVTAQRGALLSGNAALMAATAPLFKLLNGASLTTTFELVSGSGNATATLGSVASLDAASMRVGAGAALALAGNARATVNGDVFTLANGSRLTLPGVAISLSGNSSLTATGSIFNFVGLGNVVTVTNSLCGGACPLIGGVPVFLSGGALPSQLSITNPVKNPAGGAVNYSSPAAALISVNGSNPTLTILGR